MPDAFYTSDWNPESRLKVAQEISERLQNKHDIDLMIAMGTWAGLDLNQKSHQTPLLVMSASDAVSSGIVRKNKYSGYKNIHAHTDPHRYERQVRFFHDLVGFKALGIIFTIRCQ
jgi:ABC-type uncharacterized transport system substrate-binding protein